MNGYYCPRCDIPTCPSCGGKMFPDRYRHIEVDREQKIDPESSWAMMNMRQIKELQEKMRAYEEHLLSKAACE